MYLVNQTIRFAKWVHRKILRKPARRPLIDPVRQWSWIQTAPFGTLDPKDPPATNTLTWFIPPVGRGSGGHLNIFRFIAMLEERGFDCRIVICHESRTITAEAAKQEITDWFFPLKAPVYMHPSVSIPSTHFAIATGWQTAYPVKAFKGCVQPLYFVQDYEPWFQGAGSVAAFAEATYRFGFPAITAGDWLATMLREKYGMRTFPIGFGVDHELYRPLPKEPGRQGRHVLFYARPPTERRGFELGMLALHKLTAQMPDVTVHFVGWPMDRYAIPFRHVDHGILPLERLAELYSQCDAALVLSFSNVSLLPLEIMACGCPVVSNDGANVEWLVDKDNALLVEPTVESVIIGLVSVLTKPALAHKLITTGLATTSKKHWNTEGLHLAQTLNILAKVEYLQSIQPSTTPQGA
jgi:glycosyltransferase involved in cell wall biosynthesis